MTTATALKSMIDKLTWNTKVRFIGCRNELPDKCLDNEWGIVLLAENNSNITISHWVSYFVRNETFLRDGVEVKDSKPYYFCSYGSLIPSDLKKYLSFDNKNKILGHTFRIQDFNSSICGELCIVFCFLLDKGLRYEDIILNLI